MIVVSASVVLYKNGTEVINTVTDFLNTTLSVHLFLIDNSPANDALSELSSVIADERVTYIFNNQNVGYGAGHNIAIKRSISLSKYHLVLNPDVRFDKGTLEAMVDYSESNQQVGLLTPKVLYPNGELQYVCKLLPAPADLIFRRFLPVWLISSRNNTFELRQSGYNKIFQAPYIHGCCMFVRTAAFLKAGLFDERFFMYPEDIDLTRRIHQFYQTVFFPGATVVHKHEKASYKSTRLLIIHIKNMIRYFNKWGWFYDEERKRVNEETLRQFENKS